MVDGLRGDIHGLSQCVCRLSMRDSRSSGEHSRTRRHRAPSLARPFTVVGRAFTDLPAPCAASRGVTHDLTDRVHGGLESVHGGLESVHGGSLVASRGFEVVARGFEVALRGLLVASRLPESTLGGFLVARRNFLVASRAFLVASRDFLVARRLPESVHGVTESMHGGFRGSC